MRAILHVDMDAFFASVEQRDDPRLRGRPVLVGGTVRGVVAAASYEARPFGVHSAMSMAEALRRCPHAAVVFPRHDHYAEVSGRVFAIFRRFTPLVEGLSLDEAFLDVTASRALFGDGAAIARSIKDAVRAELELTASAGVAPCKFVAKIASDVGKPDGLLEVKSEGVRAFLDPLPIERMWGIGAKTSPGLRRAGIRTLGDLANASLERLTDLLGNGAVRVQELARGIDDRAVEPDWPAKSVSAEATFDHDLTELSALERRLLEQAERVAQRLVREELAGRIVIVKVKYSDFTLCTRRVTLPEPVADTGSIYAAAKELLARVPLSRRRVRLTGVGVSGLTTGAQPTTLFPDQAALRRKRLEEVKARAADRFGKGALMPAALLAMEQPDKDGKSS